MSGDTWLFLGVMYTLVAVITFCLEASIASYPHTSASTARNAARKAFAAPVWPLLILLAIWRGLADVWRAADLGRSS